MYVVRCTYTLQWIINLIEVALFRIALRVARGGRATRHKDLLYNRHLRHEGYSTLRCLGDSLSLCIAQHVCNNNYGRCNNGRFNNYYDNNHNHNHNDNHNHNHNDNMDDNNYYDSDLQFA